MLPLRSGIGDFPETYIMTTVPPSPDHPEIKQLETHMADYLAEREHIRTLMKSFGSAPASNREKWLNRLLVVVLGGLLLFDGIRFAIGSTLPLPPGFSVEAGLILISIKLLWMLHQQTRMEHFQFWILSSIEFRVNEMDRRLQQLSDGRTPKNP